MDILDIYLEKPNKKKEKHQGLHEANNVEYQLCSMQGWRKQMEDAHIIALINNISLFAVFDGHGGKQISEYAKHHFTKILENNANFKSGNYVKALEQSFIELDEQLLDSDVIGKLFYEKYGITREECLTLLKNLKKPDTIPQDLEIGQELHQDILQIYLFTEKSTTPKEVHKQLCAGIIEEQGCTANVILVTRDDVICANCGDSRSVGVNIHGEIVELSIDHKPEDVLEKKRIEKAGGFVEDDRVQGVLNLSRAFGDYAYKQNKKLDKFNQMVIALPEIKKFSRKYIKVILQACDGIWEGQTNEGVFQMIDKFETDVVSKLFDSLIAKDLNMEQLNGYDNMTAILITLNPVPPQSRQNRQVNQDSRSGSHSKQVQKKPSVQGSRKSARLNQKREQNEKKEEKKVKSKGQNDKQKNVAGVQLKIKKQLKT